MKNLVKTPLKDVTTPGNGTYRIYKDYWWIVTPDNEIMQYGGRSFQCNANRKVSEAIRDKIYPQCEVRKIPLVFIPER